MASYLDKTGLTYFWSKIKTYVSNAISSGNAATVNGHSVNTDVPSNAVFTDTTYSNATQSTSGLMSATDKTTLDNLASGTVSDVKVNNTSVVSNGVANIPLSSSIVAGAMSAADKAKSDRGNVIVGKIYKVVPSASGDNIVMFVIQPDAWSYEDMRTKVLPGTMLFVTGVVDDTIKDSIINYRDNTIRMPTFAAGSGFGKNYVTDIDGQSVTLGPSFISYNGTSGAIGLDRKYIFPTTTKSLYIFDGTNWNWIGQSLANYLEISS